MSRHRVTGAPSRRRVALWPLLSLALVVTLLIGWAGWTWVESLVARGSAAERQCIDGDLTLEVAAAPGVADPLGSIADLWNQTDPSVSGVCVRAEVTEFDSAYALNGLAESWDLDDGPRPHAWVPDSSLWVDRLTAKDPDALGSAPSSVATSPVLLAVPAPVAEALRVGPSLRWSDLPQLVTGAGWAGYGHPEWGSVAVAMPDVAANPASALVLQSVLAASSMSGGGPVTVQTLSEPRVRSALAALAASSAVDTPPTTAEALARLDEVRGDPAVAPFDAVPVVEQDLYLYNRTAATPTLTGIPVAGPTPTADFPFVAIADDNRVAVQAAQMFRGFVQEPAQGQAFTQAGLRVGNSTDFPADSPGVSWAATAQALAPADPNTAQQIGAAWSSAEQGGQALTVLVDVSQSMNEDAGGDRSRLRWTQDALRGQIDRATDGSLALWEFSRGLDGAAAHRRLVAAGSIVERRDELSGAVSRMRAASATDLYASLPSVYRSAVQNHQMGRANLLLVVVDSPDDSGIDIEDLLAELASIRDDQRPVRIAIIALGPDVDREGLTRIADAVDGTVSLAPEGVDLEPAVGELLSSAGR